MPSSSHSMIVGSAFYHTLSREGIYNPQQRAIAQQNPTKGRDALACGGEPLENSNLSLAINMSVAFVQNLYFAYTITLIIHSLG